MEDNSKPGTDAAPTKAVSSLRSLFEGLKPTPNHDDQTSSGRPSPFALRPTDSPIGTPQTRASFEIPRPLSPWAGLDQRGADSPRTPAAQKKRAESPPKVASRRPVSMLAQPSPQLTPAVNVESPRSPPRTDFNRSASRSPERIDTTPFAKVRDLISHHSSASSTRPPTPHNELVEYLSDKPKATTNTITSPIPTDIPKTSPKPPPINRADKPKIPVKPIAISSQNGGPALVPEQRRPSYDARISPFNTPPSGEEGSSPIESPDVDSHVFPVFKSAPQQNAGLGIDRTMATSTEQSLPKSSDPRFMGFVKPATVQERKDPRSFGFSKPEMPPPIREPVQPARANTVSERSVAKDARDSGFSPVGRPPQRVVSEQVRQPPPPPPSTQPTRTQSVKDPRTLGFSSAAAVAPEPIAEEPAPGLPPRHIVKAPPPRPSEESKNTPSRTVRQPSIVAVPDRSTKPSAAPPTPISRTPTVPVDSQFPPPPKRTAEFESGSSQTHPATTAIRSRPLPSEPPRQTISAVNPNDSDEAEEFAELPPITRTDYPDTTQANRRPPVPQAGIKEINVKSDSRAFDVCGKYVCTAGYVTRIFDLSEGEQLMSINHGETVKVTAVVFKPAATLEEEGKKIWTGNNAGDLHEVDVITHATVTTSSAHNRREIVQILRYRKSLWTLDDDGKLFVWPPDESGVPNLRYSHISHKVQKGHTYSLVVDDKLWLATGREIRIYKPGNEASFAALTKPLSQSGAGDITSGTFSDEQGGRVYFGHTDGKVTIYSTKDYTCVANVKASDYKINGLAFVGDKLWAAYKTGKIYVYDTTTTPWKVKKDWRAHDGPAAGVILDSSSVWTLGRLQVTSVGHDNFVKFWDGMLEDDWIETSMHERNAQYCRFREVKAAVVTWNVGASTPYDLKSDFIADAIHVEDPPDILVFGFQEVVDLEDRAVTAKSIFGFGKKKDPVNTDQQQSRVYREWRDYLGRIIDRYTNGSYTYTELHTSSLIGLFQCIFIRQTERQKVRDVVGINVKCGMKGHYGNKGALVARFILDDSSLCFINCHLAAGQTSTSHRNNDVAVILEAESLPAELDQDERMSLYIGGGDGTQILDHEICILNGDLNYRIDTVPRDTVINMIKRNELSSLLNRDQLLVSRRRIAGFRLAAFSELPITFAPTYKYDVGTDNYDSSEKKRAPAWCDRLLYRGAGRVQQLEYRRHEVRVSDHRPVSGLFKLRVKTIDANKRAKVKDECHEQFGVVKRSMAEKASISYLVNILGVSEREAKTLLRGG